jgi:cytochrome c
MVLAAVGMAAIGGAAAASADEGEAQFLKQCGVCHSLNPAEHRQGPTLHGVMGRKAGKVEGFAYSPGLAKADWMWDEARLDAWLAEPHDVVPDTFMMYKQADPAIRAAIIQYLMAQK